MNCVFVDSHLPCDLHQCASHPVVVRSLFVLLGIQIGVTPIQATGSDGFLGRPPVDEKPVCDVREPQDHGVSIEYEFDPTALSVRQIRFLVCGTRVPGPGEPYFERFRNSFPLFRKVRVTAQDLKQKPSTRTIRSVRLAYAKHRRNLIAALGHRSVGYPVSMQAGRNAERHPQTRNWTRRDVR